jgi:carbon storage regulator
VVLGIKNGQVRLGVEAPRTTEVHRDEVCVRIQEENQLAARSPVVPFDDLRRLLRKKLA